MTTVYGDKACSLDSEPFIYLCSFIIDHTQLLKVIKNKVIGNGEIISNTDVLWPCNLSVVVLYHSRTSKHRTLKLIQS